MPISVTKALRALAVTTLEGALWALEREFKPLINEMRAALFVLQREKRSRWEWVTVLGGPHDATLGEGVVCFGFGAVTVNLPEPTTEDAGLAVLVSNAGGFTTASVAPGPNTINGSGATYSWSTAGYHVFEWTGTAWMAEA